tara:strand:- start:1185 stop:1853 length:669 start_codon:yes stop_codon:yes gene_type:complete
MNINRFMGHIDQMSRKNRFEIDIFMPALDLRIRGLRVTTVTTPGKSITVEQFKPVPAGYAKNTIKGVEYPQEVTITCMCDSHMEDRQKIELWQNYMYDDDYSMRYAYNDTSGKQMGYVGTVAIRQLDRSGQSVYEVQLEDAFPQTLGGLSFDMASSDIQTFDVTFNYRTWHSAYENTPAGSILGALFQKGMRKIGSKVRKKVEDKVYKEGRRSLSNRLGLGD